MYFKTYEAILIHKNYILVLFKVTEVTRSYRGLLEELKSKKLYQVCSGQQAYGWKGRGYLFSSSASLHNGISFHVDI